jgi:hypothetical protein
MAFLDAVIQIASWSIPSSRMQPLRLRQADAVTLRTRSIDITLQPPNRAGMAFHRFGGAAGNCRDCCRIVR